MFLNCLYYELKVCSLFEVSTLIDKTTKFIVIRENDFSRVCNRKMDETNVAGAFSVRRRVA